MDDRVAKSLFLIAARRCSSMRRSSSSAEASATPAKPTHKSRAASTRWMTGCILKTTEESKLPVHRRARRCLFVSQDLLSHIVDHHGIFEIGYGRIRSVLLTDE